MFSPVLHFYVVNVDHSFLDDRLKGTMPKLKNGLIDENTIKSLARVKLFSEADFVDSDVDKVANHSNLLPKKILEIKQDLILKYSHCASNGLNLYQTLKHMPLLSTGINSLDELLDGGLRNNDIVEVCGLSGSGKSQICMTICANAAYSGKKVLFVDTKGDVTPSSLDSFLNHLGPECDDHDEILGRIDITESKDMYQFLSVLNSIKCGLEKEENWNNYDVIIVDSMSVLYLPFVGLPVSDGLGLLNHAVATLRIIVNQFNKTSIVTNLGTKWDGDEKDRKTTSETEVKPLLGKYWSHVPNVRLIVHNVDNTSQRIVRVVKSCVLPIGKTCVVKITPKGVI